MIYIRFLSQLKKDQCKMFEMQEKTFWNLHRPLPNRTNDPELFIPHSIQNKLQVKRFKSLEYHEHLKGDALFANLEKKLFDLKLREEASLVSVSEASKNIIQFIEAHMAMDALLPLNVSFVNPWIDENSNFWSLDREPYPQEVRFWKISLAHLLSSDLGKELFRKFLKKEYSEENLSFLEKTFVLNQCSLHDWQHEAESIYQDYIKEGAHLEINITSHIRNKLNQMFEKGVIEKDCFKEAQEHVSMLIEKDSYARFCKSVLNR